MKTTLATADPDRVEWVGSRLGAPGPGEKQADGVYRLFGTILRVSRKDPGSIKVRWDNKRVTIERAMNLGEA